MERVDASNVHPLYRKGNMILVTGAAGSVGLRLVERLQEYEVVGLDINEMDVTDAERVSFVLEELRPDYIFHLAGAKHAPQGEEDPFHVLNVNAMGTHNVLQACGEAKVILASTCKACDPETAYGASKLIAERMVLNAGGTVIRFYNIPESCENVFRYWESLPETDPIPYTDCQRYFNSMDEVLDLLVRALELPSGRYAPHHGSRWSMKAMAEKLYPDREHVWIPRRRGDRKTEPAAAQSEEISYGKDWMEIEGPHDPDYMAREYVTKYVA